MAIIYHAHLYGLREHKYQVLKENSINTTLILGPETWFLIFLLAERDNFSNDG